MYNCETRIKRLSPQQVDLKAQQIELLKNQSKIQDILDATERCLLRAKELKETISLYMSFDWDFEINELKRELKQLLKTDTVPVTGSDN